MIRYSPRFVTDCMQQLLDEAVPEANATSLGQFFMENDWPIALTLILVGYAGAIFCFVGAMAACCGCKGVLKVYAIILAIFIIAEVIGVGIVFGTLENTVDDFMIWTLKGIYVKDKRNPPGVYAWFLIMTKDNVTCCGMNNYTDFGSNSESVVLQRFVVIVHRQIILVVDYDLMLI
ncbi:unnamed protein product [Dibothriocephalus latus]|uniref:Tetraspanin n=1 Tax=Dibothriocephalus latus TaxID=60516 RepID=A0A3P7NQU1_DIBLA|nr:unnamed protein product [Dibothriocephalus latus]